jgi:hypothetical protein
MATTPLIVIQEAIEDLDYSVVHLPPEEGAPFERLHVLIGVDSEEHPLSLQLSPRGCRAIFRRTAQLTLSMPQQRLDGPNDGLHLLPKTEMDL